MHYIFFKLNLVEVKRIMENITDANFQETISKSDSPVIVDFWAEWCMPCKMITPVLEEIAEDYDGKIQIMKMNIDENPDTPQQFGITGIPTLIIFQNGEAVENIIGVVPKTQIEEAIKKYI